MVVVRGYTKELLNKSKEACLLAVDIYNKPKTSFKSGGYIVLMNIAWTSLFHAIFQKNKINYFYRDKNNPRFYKRVDGDKKAWEIKTCVKEYFKNIDYQDKNEMIKFNAIRDNINFFIPLRNKIEHRHVPELDKDIFGECQALLHNFEFIITREFGEEHAIGESLNFSLQFSKSTEKNIKPSCGYEEIKNSVMEYRSGLPSEILANPNYRFQVALIQVNNPNKADLAIQFIKEDSLSKEFSEEIYHQIGLIREKQINVSNKDNLKASTVYKNVQKELRKNYKFKISFNAYHHRKCAIDYKAYNKNNKMNTDSNFCIYDKVFEKHSYTLNWQNYLINKLKNQDELLRLFPKNAKKLLNLYSATEVIKEIKKYFKKEHNHKIKFGTQQHAKHVNDKHIKPENINVTENEEYCFYDGTSYLYTQKWLDYLIKTLREEYLK